MATPLESHAQKRAQPYQAVEIPVLGGEDLDAGDVARQQHRFKSLRNMRIEKPGEIVTRTGQTEHELDKVAIPVAKCEFVAWAVEGVNQTEHRFDITAYYFAATNSVYAYILSKLDPADTDDVLVTGGITEQPLVDIVQYGPSLIMTVYGTGVWEIYNNEDDGSGAWNVKMLGKELCPLPSEIGYSPEVTGDLHVYESSRNSFPAAMQDQMQLEYAKLDDGTFSIIEVPMNATYYLADEFMSGDATDENMGLGLTNPKRWTFHEDDSDLGEGRPISHNTHMRTNAWGYKFVFLRKYKRAGGQEFIIRSHPSVDLWVRDSIYCPPSAWNLEPVNDAENTGVLGNIHYYNYADGGFKFLEYPEIKGAVDDLVDVHIVALPSTEAMNQFRTELLSYMNVDDPGTGQDVRVENLGEYKHLAYTMLMAGYRWVPESVWNISHPPYKREISAYELKRAPLIEFNFSDFNISDMATVTEIEVYRTAYSETPEEENEQENIDSALFQPHKYGYVGSIKPDESFFDDIPDEEIVFGSSPDEYEGFLQTQFSGTLLREYQRKVALANIENNYWVFRPMMHAQAFLIEDHDGEPFTGYTADELLPAADGFDVIAFHYAYIDMDGNQSDIENITVDGLRAGLGLKHVAFVFPKGYAPGITAVRLFRSEYDVGTQRRTYYRIKDISVTDETYVSDRLEAAVTASTSKNIVSNNEPGAVMYSSPNEPYHWPVLNQEVIDPINPINAMEVLLGQLWIQSDHATHLTLLAGPGQERGEEETKHLGCIARRGWAKVDKVFFFLSQHGFYYMEASGPVAVGQAQSEILRYVREEIDGMPALANARRATIGVLKRRDEVWLHFPSSRDLGGSLPHRTFVFKLVGGNVHAIEEYEFDLTSDFAPQNLAVGAPIEQALLNVQRYRAYTVLFSAHGDGRLYSSHYDTRQQKMFVIEHDTDEHCPVPASWTMACSLGLPTTPKTLRKADIRMSVDARLTLYTGQARPDGRFDAIRGHITGRSRPNVVTVTPQRELVYEHEPIPRSTERTSSVLHVRGYSVPDPERQGNHRVILKGMTLWLYPVHQHP